MTTDVTLETRRGSAQDLHGLQPPDSQLAHVWLLRPLRSAVVLGSQQKADALRIDAVEAAGYEIAERRSGGGAVLVHPDDTFWVDVWIPAGHRLWDDDLARTFLTVGSAWQQVLAERGYDTTMWGDRSDRSDAARVACFAGRGWGELMLGGIKVLGLSQRRTRYGARVQCLFDPAGAQRRLVPLMVVVPALRAMLIAHLTASTQETLEFDGLADALCHALQGQVVQGQVVQDRLVSPGND